MLRLLAIESSNALSKIRNTTLAAVLPRPIFEKTVNTWIARESNGGFSAEKDEDNG
jgi:hypothetical protein